MSEAVETLEGWYALHDFRLVDWGKWRDIPAETRQTRVREFKNAVRDWENVSRQGTGTTGIFRILGHKADLLFVHFRPTLRELGDLELYVDKSSLGPLLKRPYSYFSVVELSKYLARGQADPKTNPELRARLEPSLPDLDTVCFYPMNKRRQGADNWYRLSREERREMMKSHGAIGHRYHDRVIQIITGSQGLDDWEWGVTLFSDDPIAIKKLVYEMRFDEASARFADFGPFLVGTRLAIDDLDAFFALD